MQTKIMMEKDLVAAAAFTKKGALACDCSQKHFQPVYGVRGKLWAKEAVWTLLRQSMLPMMPRYTQTRNIP
jgi:hypothetical protein